MSEKPNSREEFVQMLRDQYETVTGWIKGAWTTHTDDDYEKSEEYQAARDYYRKFKSQEGIHYDIAIAYAQELHERYDKADKVLDEKADAIIKYLVVGLNSPLFFDLPIVLNRNE